MKDTTFTEKSELAIYSLGVVVKNLGSTIQVSPVESFNAQTSGLISKNKNEYTAQHPNEKGKVVKTKVSSNNILQARWLPLGASNRATAPTVYPNETVLLWRYGNEDKFFWTSLFHETQLRKTESVVYSYSNLPDEEGPGKGWQDEKTPNAYSKSTSYWMEINPLAKFVRFTTPDNDEEITTYSISINTGSGVLEISDGMQNSFKIESKAGVITINAREKLVLNAGKGGIHLNSENGIHFNAKTDIKVFANNNLYYRAIKHNFEGMVHNADTVNCMAVVLANGFGRPPKPGVSSSNNYTQQVEKKDSKMGNTQKSLGEMLADAINAGAAQRNSTSGQDAQAETNNAIATLMGRAPSTTPASGAAGNAVNQTSSGAHPAVNSNVQPTPASASIPTVASTTDLATLFKNTQL